MKLFVVRLNSAEAFCVVSTLCYVVFACRSQCFLMKRSLRSQNAGSLVAFSIALLLFSALQLTTSTTHRSHTLYVERYFTMSES